MSLEPRKFGKYLLLDRIGSGGMAEIFRARQFGAAGFQKQLAVKKILNHLADNDEFVRMFIDEAKIAVTLQHANIVQIYDLGSVQREYFIAMEYVAGKDLLALLIRCTQLRIRVPHKLAIYIVTEALKGLEAAHTAVDGRGRPLKIIHRDVSPSNVLISYDGEIKLGDFGVARAAFREGRTRAGTMKGKLGYMSPEQVVGAAIDQRTDLFSVGVILYELLAMNRLFSAKTELETMMMVKDCDPQAALERLPPGVPDGLLPILERALARDPADRYPTATELLDALLDHLFHEQIRVSGQDMGRFMKSVFAKEIDEERARQASLDQAVEARLPELRRPSPAFPGVRSPLPGTPTPRAVEWIPDTPAAWTPQSTFRIKDKDGIVFGPLGVATLVQLIEKQGIQPGEALSIDGGDWTLIQQLPEVVRSLKALAVSGKHTPDFEGSFDRFAFPRLLYRYAALRATGRLHLATGPKRKEIFWRDGRPEYITSNLKGELLGEYMVRQRIISRETLDAALARLGDFDGRLGDALRHFGALGPHDLFSALSAQVRDKVIEIFGWPGGAYRFYRGEETAAQIVPLELGALRLIFEGVRRRYKERDLRAFFAPHLDRPWHRQAHRLLSEEHLPLSATQRTIWQAVEHGPPLRHQLGRLRAIPGADDADILRLLFLMERLDFARPG